MKRHTTISCLIIATLLLAPRTALPAADARPNIVFILADDIGYGDLGCYGAKQVKTPHCDQLVREGVRFTDAHAPGAVCTPTRYAFITGQYAWRNPLGAGILSGEAPLAIDPTKPTTASLLKQAGYTTGLVGKWHIGLGKGDLDFNGELKPGPLELGFDGAFFYPATGDRVPCVFIDGHHVVGLEEKDPIRVSYQKKIGDEPTGKEHPELLTMKPSLGHDSTIINGISRIGFMSGGKAARWKDEEMADTLTQKAVAFIQRNAGKPFFLYLATHNIHVPRVPHPRWRGTSPHGTRGDFIQEFDGCVGEVLATLDKLKLAGNTLVIVTSDNGGVMDDGYQDGSRNDTSGHRCNGGLRGFKGSLYEGGHRIPFIARWPGKIKPGTESKELISLVDMMATFAAIVGEKLPADAGPDSFNVLPALLGEKTPRDHLIVQMNGIARQAVRQGPWKFIPPPPANKTKAAELYHLDTDLGEQKDLAAQNPAKAGELAALLQKVREQGQSRLPGFAPDRVTSLTLDVSDQGAVISPLLFSHNLEVTRRAVWSGLGAEMVANRKFAAVKDGLPRRWAALPGGGSIALDNQEVFVGQHSIRLGSNGTGGLLQQQDTLAFRQGARYVFRWWLKTTEKRPVWMRITDAPGTKVLFQAEKSLQPGEWQLWTGRFVAPVTTTNACLELGSKTAGVFWVGAASLQPADAFHGMRRDVIELLKQIKPGGLRFPGGCYSEFYRWQDGLLPLDRRPPLGPTGLDFLLRDSDDVDTQELGIDEFIALCREIGCEPALTLRLSETSPEAAAAWVEYCNGSPTTKWGRIRAARGQRKPYGVKTWFLGNELYFFGRGGMNNATNCARQSKAFGEAVKQVDASVRLVGCTSLVGGVNNQAWNTALLEQAGSLIKYISCHDYLQGYFDPKDLQAYATASTRYLRPAFKKYQQELGLPVVFDEWNTMWGQPGSVGMGLCAAGVLNLLCREAEALGVEQAYFFQPVTEGVIRITPLAAELDPAGRIFAAFKAHQGNRVLKLPEMPADAALDTCASASSDGRRVYVTVVNRSATKDQRVELLLKSVANPVKAKLKLLIASDASPQQSSFEERSEQPALLGGNRLAVTVPRSSVAVLELVAKRY